MAEYSPQYQEQSFYVWHENGKSFGGALLDKLPPNENGNKPSIATLKKWSEENGWVERADALDGVISLEMDKSVIQKRVEMYEKHAELADELITMGREFLKKQGENGGIKSENAAIRAIELGVQVERVSVGVSDMVRKIGEMTPDQLDNELRKLLGQKKDEEFTEGVTTEVPNDTESNDAGI